MLNLVKAYQNGIIKREEKQEEPRKFFYISDLGMCERQIIYRFTDFPKKPKNPNELEKMHMGNVRHKIIYDTWDISGELDTIATELSLNRWLPDMWHGRLDRLLDDFPKIAVADIKTTHPKNFSYELLKPQHEHQLKGYILGIIEMLNLKDIPDGYLLYADNGGSNTPQQKYFQYKEKDFDGTKRLMEAYEINLELFRKEGILPPFIEMVRKKSGLSVPWNCDYCDYEGVTCRIKEDLL